MSEEFKQSLQSIRKEIIIDLIKQCKNNKPGNVKHCIKYFSITKEEISKNCINVLYKVLENNGIKVTALLLKYGIKPEQCTSLIWYASVYNNIEIIKLFLAHGMKPGQCIRALNNAVYNNHIEIVKLFLAHGIKPEQCIDALKTAKKYNYEKIITLLENYINKNNVKTDQEIIKQLFTLSKQLKDHSISITVINIE